MMNVERDYPIGTLLSIETRSNVSNVHLQIEVRKHTFLVTDYFIQSWTTWLLDRLNGLSYDLSGNILLVQQHHVEQIVHVDKF